MGTVIPGTTYGGYAGYGTAMPTYGTAMPSYGTTYATPTYGGYGGYGTAAMDASTVETQLKDAQGVLSTQYGVQEKMLTHQKEAQLSMLEAEKTRSITQLTMQYEMQYKQRCSRSSSP